MVPDLRVRPVNDRPLRADGAYVLYWMTAHRRPYWNHALQRAVEQAKALGKPLLVVEALGLRYSWASDRLHRFVIAGMAANAAAFARGSATYVPWVEGAPGQLPGGELLATLDAQACLVVCDEFPCFIQPGLVAALAARVTVRCEAVDANGLLPLRATEGAKDRAYDFRRLLQKTLRPHLGQFPAEDPLRRAHLPPLLRLPAGIAPADLPALLAGGIVALPIDHRVGPALQQGGWQEADRALDGFVAANLDRYAESRSDIEAEAASGLSPYLHFGHLSAHQVVAAVWALSLIHI